MAKELRPGGVCRIVDAILEAQVVVEVVKVGHRSEVHRGWAVAPPALRIQQPLIDRLMFVHAGGAAC